jgi:hypothetical protein
MQQRLETRMAAQRVDVGVARQACFWRLLRSAASASRRARSAAETSTVIPSRMPRAWHGP